LFQPIHSPGTSVTNLFSFEQNIFFLLSAIIEEEIIVFLWLLTYFYRFSCDLSFPATFVASTKFY
jgi:hypothetical protein